MPSGAPAVSSIRKQLIRKCSLFEHVPVRPVAFPTMIIDVNLFPGNSGFEDDMVYVGSGGLSHRPSPWASPFGCRSCYEILDTSSSPPDDSSFLRYASSRADKITWLAPLIGKRLVCSCNNKNIHIGVLATLIESTFDVIAVPEASPI